jgi:hypothetical protein
MKSANGNDQRSVYDLELTGWNDNMNVQHGTTTSNKVRMRDVDLTTVRKNECERDEWPLLDEMRHDVSSHAAVPSTTFTDITSAGRTTL